MCDKPWKLDEKGFGCKDESGIVKKCIMTSDLSNYRCVRASNGFLSLKGSLTDSK